MTTCQQPSTQVINRPDDDCRTDTRQRGPRSKPVCFEDLFTSERRRLLRALCVITRDPSEAEEVGQEAFVRILERWDRVAVMDDPVGYLYRVAINIFRSGCRRARLAARIPVPDAMPDEIAEVDERDVTPSRFFRTARNEIHFHQLRLLCQPFVRSTT